MIEGRITIVATLETAMIDAIKNPTVLYGTRLLSKSGRNPIETITAFFEIARAGS